MVTHTTKPRVLFVCGSLNQTTQLHAIADELPECSAFFTPFYTLGVRDLARHAGFLENTILGNKLRARCLAYLTRARLPIDLHGQRGPYELVVLCTDLLIPSNVREQPLLVVQEGMTDPETILSRWVDRLALPPWIAGTTLTATRGEYDVMCVASEGYRDLFVQRGAPGAKLRVTGIPNFDDCERFRHNAARERDYVLLCTSDLRENMRRDHRERFLVQALRVARGRPIHVRFHPNENLERAMRELRTFCPRAQIHPHHDDEPCTEELIANCAVLMSQVSSVAFVGLALGKEVHSYFDLNELRRLMPLQNGGCSAANIAAVCRELLGLPSFVAAAKSGSEPMQASRLQEAAP
jgi:hypothetical protein